MHTFRNILSFLLPVLTALPLLTGCQSSPAAAIEGEYTLSAQSVQINGVIVNIVDWPGSSVTLSAMDDENVTVETDSLLLGFDRLTVTASTFRESRGKYTFTTSGPYSANDREISLSGSVRNGNMSLSITDMYQSPVTGRWEPAYGEDGLALVSVDFSNPLIQDIPLGDGETLPLDSALTMLNVLIRSSITPMLENLDGIDMGRTGYIGISWKGEISPGLEPVLHDVIQYWPEPDASRVHIYLRRTITEGIGLPVSPLDFALAYSVSGELLTLRADQDASAPLTELLVSAVQDLTYRDYVEAGSPLGGMTEEEFDRFRTTASMLAAVLGMPETEYSIEIILKTK